MNKNIYATAFLLCLGTVWAANNYCVVLGSGTVCMNGNYINGSGGTFYFANNNTSGGGTDGNNYTTSISVNQTGNAYSIVMPRNGASTLIGNFTVTPSSGGNGNLTMDSNITGWPLQASNSTHITNIEVACDYASGYAIGRLSNNSVCFQTLLPATATATYLTITNAANTYTTQSVFNTQNTTNYNTFYPYSNPYNYLNNTTIPADTNDTAAINGLYTNLTNTRSNLDSLVTNTTNTQNNLNSLTSNYTTTVGYVNGLYFNLTNAQSYINSLTTNLTNTQSNLNSLYTNTTNTFNSLTTNISSIQSNINSLVTNTSATQSNLNSLTSNYTTTVGYVNGLYTNQTSTQNNLNSLVTNTTNTQNNLNSLTSNVTNLTNVIDLGATGTNSFRLNLTNGKNFNVTLSSGSGGENLVTLNSTNGTDAHNITLTWDNGTTFTTTINDQSGGSGISTFNATNGSTIVNSTTNAVVNITAGNNINVAVNDQGTFNISQLKLPQSVLLFDEWVDPYYGGSIEDGEAGMMGWNVVALGTGAGASMTSAQREPGRRGIMNLTTGSTNGGNVTVHLSVNMIYFNATSGKLIQFGGFNIGTTSGANNITYLMGFGDQTAGTAAAQNDTDAIWIAYNASGGNNNLSLITRSNSVQSENVTDIQVTAEKFYDYQLIVYNNTRVELYIDEQLKAILNTNIPSGNTRLLGPMQKLRKLGTNTGATAVMVGVDYYGIRYEFEEKK